MPIVRSEALATYIKSWIQSVDSDIAVVGPLQKHIPAKAAVLNISAVQWITDRAEGPDLVCTATLMFNETNDNAFVPEFDFSLIPNGNTGNINFDITSLSAATAIDRENYRRETTWTSTWEVRQVAA